MNYLRRPIRLVLTSTGLGEPGPHVPSYVGLPSPERELLLLPSAPFARLRVTMPNARGVGQNSS